MTRRAVPFVLIAIFAVALAIPAAAQTPTDLAQAVKRGDVVVVTGLDQERIVGRISAVTSGTITLDVPGGQRTLSTSSLGRVVVKDSLGNGTKIGLAIGVVGGAIGGWALNSLCENETGVCPGAVLGVVALGAGIGAGIGAAADSMHVRTAYRITPDFPSEFSSETGFDIGGGTIADRGNTFRTPLSVGGSWRYMNVSGFGVEFEMHRSFGQALRTTPCVTVNTRSSEFANQCVGPVEEGFGSEVSSSARFVYAFPGRRLRPYVTSGAAISTLERHRPVFFVTGNQLQVFNGVGKETGAQVLAGGGLRIALTDRVSIRPDVTFAFADDTSRVRASVGVAYRW